MEVRVGDVWCDGEAVYDDTHPSQNFVYIVDVDVDDGVRCHTIILSRDLQTIYMVGPAQWHSTSTFIKCSAERDAQQVKDEQIIKLIKTLVI